MLRRIIAGLVLCVFTVFPLQARGAISIGVLSDGSSTAKLGPQARGAQALATAKYSAKVIRVVGDGKFLNGYGRTVLLSSFDVLWYHQGDSTSQTGPMYGKKTSEALRAFVSSGKGLYLSGAALAMVRNLGVENLKLRLGGPGKGKKAAGFVPVQTAHPIFSRLKSGKKGIMLSSAGSPAYSDFHGSGGPVKGMVLGRTSGGVENPIVEYELGSGRIIAMGWGLPNYDLANNRHRGNLERLTINILGYLSQKKRYQKIIPGPGVQAKARRSTKPAQPPQPKIAIAPLRLAINDLVASNREKYPNGAAYLKRLAVIEKKFAANKETPELLQEFVALRAEALLANPLLDFDKLLLVRRGKRNMGLVKNWQGNSSLRGTGYDNEIAVMSPVSPKGEIKTLYKPEGGKFVGDVDLHFDGDKMLFSIGAGSNGRWQVCEMKSDGSGLRELPLILEKDVLNYDACYLPDGNVIFNSTAPFIGVPCVTGSSHVTNMYLLQTASGKIRRLGFDQEHTWCPTVLNNGRVLYLRWEYSDLPHFVARILFHMNPDGTDQKEYYGGSSYWPNSTFFARPIPGSSTKFTGIIGGHHDSPRMGEMILFDTGKGRFEADGVVQRIPGYGKKVEPVILDGLVGRSWPKFLHPYPLSDKYFIVSSQPTSKSEWGIYLVDVFDNMLLLKQEPGYVLFEPIPLRKTPRPPVIPSRVDPSRKDAVMYMADIYSGRGLKGVPKGSVKKLRIFTYQYSYHGMGGQKNRVGLDGPWDIKRVLGTVPVESDGSAMFRIPANTPISMQPLDADGRAMAIMRSWATAMPGETQSCIGCHERQNDAPPTKRTIAARQKPSEITPWYGPTRGFSFKREVQPVLDRYCVGCHDGKPRKDARKIPDFIARPAVRQGGTQFTPSYVAMRSYVRGITMEGDMHMLEPYEVHASTTALVQILEKGHHNVKLPTEAWDRIVTWIDLNTPAHGTWKEIVGEKKVNNQRDRRRAMLKLYASIDEDPENIIALTKKVTPIIPAKTHDPAPRNITARSWPFSPAQAAKMQAALKINKMNLDLGEGVTLDLVRVPAGEFVMGSTTGFRDEAPRAKTAIVRGFWMGSLEVTNAQYARFDSKHDSRLEHTDFLHFSSKARGDRLNTASQPVCRVSWNQAMAFCDWLAKKSGKKVTLPTEAQWEYACRAGSAAAMSYGPTDTNFAKLANLADKTLRQTSHRVIPPWRPAIESVSDGYRVSAPAGKFPPNAWGLHDMHGNAAEWTRSVYKAYPYKDSDGRNALKSASKRTVRGGSWYDRPRQATSSFRLPYQAHQKVYNVGFRVIIE
jgi:formylglycine-generating enzyme required for sulfatase activity